VRIFKDKTGATWSIDLTIGDVLRVKAASEGRFNLLDPAHELAAQLAADVLTFWELLWHLVEPQAAARETSAERFGDAMAASCLLAARQALFAEWSDFFRQLHRPDLVGVVELAAQGAQMAIDATAARLDSDQTRELLATLQTQLDSSSATPLKEQSGNSPDSAEWTPGPTPGDSLPT